jgi:histidine phosphotransferase ChpT
MAEYDDLRLSELLISRLCHELVGPIGAVNNGCELISDSSADTPMSGGNIPDVMGGKSDESFQKDAFALIVSSAHSSGERLKFYRAAYGLSGRSLSQLPEIRQVAFDFVDSEGQGKCHLSWPLPPMTSGMADGIGKLILNIIGLCAEALARGGHIIVELAGSDDKAVIIAEGRINIADDLLTACHGKLTLEHLTPRNVHGAYTARYAQLLGRKLEIDHQTNSLSFTF